MKKRLGTTAVFGLLAMTIIRNSGCEKIAETGGIDDDGIGGNVPLDTGAVSHSFPAHPLP